MVDVLEDIARRFDGFDRPRLMLTVAVPYIEAAVTRQNGRCNLWEAADALISTIRAGRLLAYGDDEDGQESIVPINNFANADPFPGANYALTSHNQRVLRWLNGGRRDERRSSDFIEENGRISWRNVNVETSEVLRLWPWLPVTRAVEPTPSSSPGKPFWPPETARFVKDATAVGPAAIEEGRHSSPPVGQKDKPLTRAQTEEKARDFLRSYGPGRVDEQWKAFRKSTGSRITRPDFRKIREGVESSHAKVGRPGKSRQGE